MRRYVVECDQHGTDPRPRRYLTARAAFKAALVRNNLSLAANTPCRWRAVPEETR